MNSFKVVKRTDPYHARLNSEFPPHTTEVVIEDNLSKEDALSVLEDLVRDFENTHDGLTFVDVENNPDARIWVEDGVFDYQGAGLYDCATGSAVWVAGDEMFSYDVMTFSIERSNG